MLLVPTELGRETLELLLEFAWGVCGGRRVGCPDAVEESTESFGDCTVHAKRIIGIQFFLVDTSCIVCLRMGVKSDAQNETHLRNNLLAL